MVEELKERIAEIKGILEQVVQRLNHVQSEILTLHQRIDQNNQRIDQNNQRIDQIRSELMVELRAETDKLFRMFWWVLGLILGSWITLMGAMISILIQLLKK